jgi:predicted MFS family arabinose efflux permease
LKDVKKEDPQLKLYIYFFVLLSIADEKIALLGAIQSLFEGSMYTFVFLWTPALSPHDEDIPHGFIFATFMLSSMIGSSLASRLMARSSVKVEAYMQIVFLVSAAALLSPVIVNVSTTKKSCRNVYIQMLKLEKRVLPVEIMDLILRLLVVYKS